MGLHVSLRYDGLIRLMYTVIEVLVQNLRLTDGVTATWSVAIENVGVYSSDTGMFKFLDIGMEGLHR